MKNGLGEDMDLIGCASCCASAELDILEIVCAHFLITTIAVEALEAFVRKFLTWIEVLGVALAEGISARSWQGSGILTL